MGVHVNDAIWRRMYKRAVEMRSIRARVGVLASKGGTRQAGDGDLTLVELAAIHEFGSPAAGIPERSFLRRTFYERVPDKLREVIAAIVKAVVHEEMDVRRGVGLLGAWGAAEVKNTITQTDIPPPLKPETIARKGSSKPLFDTGQLVNSITWEIVDDRKGGE